MKVCLRLSRKGCDDRLCAVRATGGGIIHEERWADMDELGRALAVAHTIEDMGENYGVEIGDQLNLELSNAHFSYR